MVLICLSNRLLTSPDSLWNRVISGADVRIVDQLLSYFVTLCYYLSLPVRTFLRYEDRDDRDRSSYNGGFEYSLCYPQPRFC